MSETHGYLPAKLGSTLAGLALAVVGTGMMAGDLWLCWSGTWTTGEVEQVVRRRDGAPEQRFSDEAALLAAEQVDARDRGWTYLPEVVFRDAGGGERRWRPNYGSQLASPWRLADDSGLPTRVAVVYDATDPGRAALPSNKQRFSTRATCCQAVTTTGFAPTRVARMPSGSMAASPQWRR